MARTIGIIGSGIGALAVGIRLQTQGYQVTIFDSRSKAGGKAAGLEVEGYRLDSGPSILRMPHLFTDLFSTAGTAFGEEFKVRVLSPLYRVYQNKNNYLDINSSRQQTTENISRFSSTDANQYENFLLRTDSIYQENLTPPPAEKSKRNPFQNLRPKGILPLQTSVFQETARYLTDPFIQQVFSFHPLLFGQNPFTIHYRNLMLHAIEHQWGILLVDGGIYQIIDVLINRFQNMGGRIALNTRVTQIIKDKKEAHILRLESGKQVHFDTLISNLSPYQTRTLMDKKNTDKTEIAPRQSTSYFVLHILFESEQTNLQPHTILSTSNYGRYAQQVFNQNQLPDDPWLYLYAQKPYNKSLQPLMVITPVPNLGSPIEWGKTTFSFRNQVVNKITRFVPGFAENIHYERISTPVTFQEDFNLPGGSPLFPPIRQKVPNLYYVGDNTWTGLGLIAALSSAEQVTKTILNENA